MFGEMCLKINDFSKDNFKNPQKKSYNPKVIALFVEEYWE
jgi:hypothetical protein